MARKLLICPLGVCAALMMCASIGQAQVKVGIVNLQKAIIETAEIKKAQAEMEVKFKPRQEAAAKLQKDLELLQAQLQSGKLSQEGAQEVQADGQRKQRELQRVQDDLQADVDHDRQEILQRVGQRMTDVVKKIA